MWSCISKGRKYAWDPKEFLSKIKSVWLWNWSQSSHPRLKSDFGPRITETFPNGKVAKERFARLAQSFSLTNFSIGKWLWFALQNLMWGMRQLRSISQPNGYHFSYLPQKSEKRYFDKSIFRISCNHIKKGRLQNLILF